MSRISGPRCRSPESRFSRAGTVLGALVADAFSVKALAFSGYATAIQLMLLLRSKGILSAAEIDGIMLDTLKNMRDANSPHLKEVEQLFASTFETTAHLRN